MTTTDLSVRTLPPPLEIQYPLCPLCKDQVWLDEETFRCGPCSAAWPSTGIGNEDGAWEMDDWDNPVPQCASTIQPYADSAHAGLRNQTFRCELNEDHLDADPQSYPTRSWDGTPIGEPATHRNGRGHEWADDDASVIVPAVGPEERKVRASARTTEGERQYKERQAARDAEWAARRAEREALPRQVEAVTVGDAL